MKTPIEWLECGQGTLIRPDSGRHITTEVVELKDFGRVFEVYHYGNDPDGDMRLIRNAPKMASAIRAALARVNGVWDDPDLVACGPLSSLASLDVQEILESALENL
jgi:hypothetical protein